MWKFFFYHSWQYEKAERFLQSMEAQGYRLEKIKCLHWFQFRKSFPKNVKYIFLYHYLKDYSCAHYDAYKYLCGACGGNQICGKHFFEPNVFRITNTQAKLSSVLQFRKTYLKRAFRLKMCTSLVFVLPAILLTVFRLWGGNNLAEYYLLAVAALALLSILYYGIGLISLRKKK